MSQDNSRCFDVIRYPGPEVWRLNEAILQNEPTGTYLRLSERYNQWIQEPLGFSLHEYLNLFYDEEKQ
jgi:hypothetical protein